MLFRFWYLENLEPHKNGSAFELGTDLPPNLSCLVVYHGLPLNT